MFLRVWGDPVECDWTTRDHILKETDFPSPVSHRLPVLHGALPCSTLECWLTWSCSSSHRCQANTGTVILSCPEDAASPWSPLTLALAIFPPCLLRWSFGIKRIWICQLEMSRAHALILCVLASCVFLCLLSIAKRKLLWLGLRDAQTYGPNSSPSNDTTARRLQISIHRGSLHTAQPMKRTYMSITIQKIKKILSSAG